MDFPKPAKLPFGPLPWILCPLMFGSTPFSMYIYIYSTFSVAKGQFEGAEISTSMKKWKQLHLNSFYWRLFWLYRGFLGWWMTVHVANFDDLWSNRPSWSAILWGSNCCQVSHISNILLAMRSECDEPKATRLGFGPASSDSMLFYVESLPSSSKAIGF